jgi:hypothetical protein
MSTVLFVIFYFEITRKVSCAALFYIASIVMSTVLFYYFVLLLYLRKVLLAPGQCSLHFLKIKKHSFKFQKIMKIN